MPLTDLMAAVRTVVSPAADRDTVLRTAADLLSCRQAGADELYANLCEREALAVLPSATASPFRMGAAPISLSHAAPCCGWTRR